MENFVLSQITNKVLNTFNIDKSVQNPYNFGAEENLTPNVPANVAANPWYLGSQFRHKGFGSICVGKDNVGYLVTRVTNAHGWDNGNLYWSKTEDEGLTWSAPTKFLQDTAGNGEDLRDVNLYYNPLIEKYFLIYTHQYGIVNKTDYSNITLSLKVWIGDEPFVNMIDVSPGVIPLDGETIAGYNMIQTFEELHMLGSRFFLPAYYVEYVNGGRNHGTILLEFDFNDTLPLSTGVTYCQWKTVKKWELTGDNETTMYVTYQENGKPRVNLLSRRGDMGYLTYSDDGFVSWSEKEAINIEIAGGPRVFEINGGYMLVAREQKLDDIFGETLCTIFTMFSEDGTIWEKRRMLSDTSSGYASVAKFKSGKTLLCYSKEFNHTGIQCVRQIFRLPI